MLTRRGAIAGAAGLALAPSAWAQTNLRGIDLRGDIAILRDAYETLHPGLYRYNTPPQMSARFDALSREFARDQSRSEAYLALSRFLATIKCGHSYANFYNQSDTVSAELFEGNTRLPFQFLWLGGRIVVTSNQSDDPRLAPGAEVLSIDGRSSARILRQLMAYARADGANDFKRRALLSVAGFDRYESFDIFHALVFPNASGIFALRVRPSGGGRVISVDTPAIGFAQRQAAMRQPEIGPQDPLWTLDFPDSATARLTMPNWALYNSGWNWRGFLDQGFAEVEARGTRKLIVDVRGNEGGNDCGDEIVARLIDAPIEREPNDRLVRYRRTPDRLNQYLDTWDNSFRDWGDDAQPAANGFYTLRGEIDDDRIVPKGPRFHGDVLVLIDAQNSSATFQFANCIQTNRLGRLVGQPTGGNRRGINGGAFFFLRLPASGLEADVPLIGRFARTPQPDAGLLPDVPIVLTTEDIAMGRDAAMAAALAI